MNLAYIFHRKSCSIQFKHQRFHTKSLFIQLLCLQSDLAPASATFAIQLLTRFFEKVHSQKFKLEYHTCKQLAGRVAKCLLTFVAMDTEDAVLGPPKAIGLVGSC